MPFESLATVHENHENLKFLIDLFTKYPQLLLLVGGFAGGVYAALKKPQIPIDKSENIE
jgi:hypothetical protein